MNKRNIFKIALASLVVFTIAISINACKKVSNPTDGVQLIIDYNLIETSFSVKFIDAATGELIGKDGTQSVIVKVTGKDAEGVIDISGIKRDSYKSNHGIASLALDPSFSPSQSNPVQFTLIATLDGYMMASKSFNLTKNGDYIVEVYMTDKDNLPNGATKVEDYFYTDPNGKVTEGIIIVSPDGKVTLLIPEGSIIKDNDGNPLTGNLHVELIHFSNMEDESLQAFPGGLQANANMEDSTNADIVFFSAGFNSIIIKDANGNEAEIIEGPPLELTMEIPQETNYFNNETGTYKNVSDNDILPVWSFDEESGSWDYETSDTVSVISGGNYNVTTELDHLSWWNWDWYWYDEWCYEGLNIYFESDDYSCNCYWVESTVRNPNNGTFMWNTWFYVCQNQPLILWNAPAFLPVNIEYQGYCNNLVTTEEFYYYENLCAPDEVYIYWESFNPGDIIDVELLAYCASEPNIEIRPSFGVWFRPADSWCWRWAQMNNGYAEVCDIEIGKDYIMALIYNNTYTEFIVTPQYDAYVYEEVELPTDVCSDVFGF